MKKPTKKPKIYLSGKITGLPDLVPELLFEEAEYDVRAMYKHTQVIIVNPIKIKHKPKSTWEDFMAKDIEALLYCDEIFMLTNWRKSKGAKIEHFIAKQMNKPIHYQKFFDELNS